jgi:hypothetical protein
MISCGTLCLKLINNKEEMVENEKILDELGAELKGALADMNSSKTAEGYKFWYGEVTRITQKIREIGMEMKSKEEV